MQSEMSQDESGSESEELQHSDVEDGEEHTREECDEDMVRDVWIEVGRHLYEKWKCYCKVRRQETMRVGKMFLKTT